MAGTLVVNAVGQELLWRGVFLAQFPGDVARGALWPLAHDAGDALHSRGVWGLPASISLPREPGGLVLCLAGEIDEAVTREFEAQHGRPVPVHAIDAGAVTFISAHGLTLMAAWARASAAAGHPAVLRESTPWLDRVLQLAGLDRELTHDGPATS
jgi:anti-anti-sigma regulatory factor